ncbi:Imm63 family immunity protein [Rhizobium leguminosarum]|uniref:Imm63 family immunity protein n=1 Tax=Rhizobium leguminosarum TaxID=384 RepID=UPI0024A85A95|nr:Imm63 family immunity protein [Rhizobium leguminosarum]MDI5927463.1 Imm63 family immunity protein [Rhizobium leguminosarum]
MSKRAEIENRFLEVAHKIGVPTGKIIVQFQGDGMATRYVDLKDSDEIYYVVEERGVELERVKCSSIDNVLYFLFSDITHDMASNYAATHGKPGTEFRRLMFQEQLRLLGLASKEWRLERELEIKEILRKAPYNDGMF